MGKAYRKKSVIKTLRHHHIGQAVTDRIQQIYSALTDAVRGAGARLNSSVGAERSAGPRQVSVRKGYMDNPKDCFCVYIEGSIL